MTRPRGGSGRSGCARSGCARRQVSASTLTIGSSSVSSSGACTDAVAGQHEENISLLDDLAFDHIVFKNNPHLWRLDPDHAGSRHKLTGHGRPAGMSAQHKEGQNGQSAQDRKECNQRHRQLGRENDLTQKLGTLPLRLDHLVPEQLGFGRRRSGRGSWLRVCGVLQGNCLGMGPKLLSVINLQAEA